MENPTHRFRDTNLALKLIWESPIKIKTVMSSRKKKRGHFLYHLFCANGTVFKNSSFMSMYSVLNTLSKYIYFYISKNITSYTSVAFLKSLKAFEPSKVSPLVKNNNFSCWFFQCKKHHRKICQKIKLLVLLIFNPSLLLAYLF